ncbi:MAG: TonB-dependent receptor domain-containing protein, partial [bacterium]
MGWTLPATPASGSTPAIATWAKPASVPYLNLFCDPTAFQCNSPTTLSYISGIRALDERYKINEKGIKADGPLFDLPGGPLKAAVGATYTTFAFNIVSLDNTNASSLVLPYQVNAEKRAVWAVFTQVNIPIFSDQNAIPFFRRLELEASWRHDQYSDFGGTSNQKVGFNWAPIDDLTLRGGWGTSFRAPNFGENSAIVNSAWNAFGLPTNIFQNNAQIKIACTNGLPVAGSGSEKLFNAGFACDSTPAGMSFNGGAKSPNLAGWREYRNQAGQVLQPEVSTNWNIGFDYSPSNNFLTGLNLQATYYIIKITGVLVGFGNPTSSRFSDSAIGFAYIVPSDLRDGSGTQLCPGMDATPWLCPQFQTMIARAISQPNNAV